MTVEDFSGLLNDTLVYTHKHTVYVHAKKKKKKEKGIECNADVKKW